MVLWSQGLARNRVTPNNRERSNIVWYRMPSLDGSIQGGEIGRFSGGGGAATDAVCPEEHSASPSQCSPPPPNLSNIVQKIAEETDDLYKTDVEQFTEHVANCLKEIDSNFGRYQNSATSNSISDDAVGYKYEEGASPCKVDIVVDANGPNPQISWTPNMFPSNTWVAADGQCIIEDIANMVPCTQEQLEDGFETVEFVCLPQCWRFSFYTTDTPPKRLTGVNFDPENEEEIYDLYGHILKHIEIGVNDLCADAKKPEYNILKIDQPADAATCCRISKKTDCPPEHYELKTIDGERACYPTCGQAAALAGYGGYGPDKKEGTSDDPHVLFLSNQSCLSQSTTFGGNWKEMPSFYDPYRFKTLTTNEAQRIFTSQSRRCCVRYQPTNTPALPHNDKGTYTTTTTTTTPTSSTTNSPSSGAAMPCSQHSDCTGSCERCYNDECVHDPNCGSGNPSGCDDGTPPPCVN